MILKIAGLKQCVPWMVEEISVCLPAMFCLPILIYIFLFSNMHFLSPKRQKDPF